MSQQRESPGPQLAGIIGYPVEHSISPAFQQAALDHLGLDIRYERWETPPDHLGPRLLSIRRPGILGANVTVPHKENALRLMDETEEMAGRIGAVNTIVNRDGRLAGYNTDAPGFLRALVQDGGLDPRGKQAFILGAGGAARAVAFALLDEGAAGITICNRTDSRAEALAEAVRPQSSASPAEVRVEVAPWGADPGEADLIVNCTTVGLRHGPTEGQCPLDPSRIRREVLVCDLVYNPVETPLLAAARKARARTLGGLPMLVYQGAIALELWTGRKPPIDVMFEAARRAL